VLTKVSFLITIMPREAIKLIDPGWAERKLRASYKPSSTLTFRLLIRNKSGEDSSAHRPRMGME